MKTKAKTMPAYRPRYESHFCAECNGTGRVKILKSNPWATPARVAQNDPSFEDDPTEAHNMDDAFADAMNDKALMRRIRNIRVEGIKT